MPLPNDEKILALSDQILQQFETLFGSHPGFRPAHAKGALLTGSFTPTPAASTLSRAPHFNRPSTPVTVRFSNSTGVPLIPDSDPNAIPKGIAIRFHLADRVHTDVIAHSTDGFPTRTADEFLEFLRAVATNSVEAFLGTHPKALAFVQAPKPLPSSFARESYFGVTAMQFTNAQGAARYGRFHITPALGTDYLADAASQPSNFLFDELAARIAKAPITFQLRAQLANEGDIVDDATHHWPADRPVLELGSITLTAAAVNDAREQQHIIFDPIPRVDGVEPSADPLLEVRAAVYLISGRRRRATETGVGHASA